MSKVLCKNAGGIYYILFGGQYSSVFSSSKFNLDATVKKNKNGFFIDTRMLDLEYYDGYKDNEHHIATRSHYNVLAPFLSYIIKTFKFDKDDFVKVPYFTKDFKHDVSYLVPKKDFHFTLSINGCDVGEHLSFDDIQNIKPHTDTEAYRLYKDDTPLHSEYHKLYRGSHACSVIINEDISEDSSIFISGDSMVIPLIPIFCCYYKEVVYMDNRDNQSHKDYFEGKTFDEVLLCFFDGSAPNKVLEINLQ